MRTLTKLLCTAFLLLAGFVSASAQDDNKVYADFSGCAADQGSLKWDAASSTFSWTQSWSNQLHGIGLPNGNITEYGKVVINCEIIEGDGYRFMFYSSEKGTAAGGTTIITTSGEVEYNFADFNMDPAYLTKNSEFCLSGYNGSGKVKVNYVYFVKSDDPLAGVKKILSDVITTAKSKSSYGKTQASWSAFSYALSAAEDALAATDATESSLQNATTNLQNAISALQLTGGFANLRSDMFHKWTTPGADATQTTDAVYPANEVGKAIGQGATILGLPGVNYLEYANLTGCNKIIITGTPGLEARLLFNRVVNEGDLTEVIEPLDENGVLEIDLKNHAKLAGAEFIHLNAFKTPWNGKTGTFGEVLLQFDYSITGELTGGWDTDMDMTLAGSEGKYTLTVKGFQAEAKEYSYKLRGAHQWDFVYQLPNEGNNTWNCTEAGTYDLTFTADVLNHTLTLDAEKISDLANIAALKNFSTEVMGAVPAVLTLTNAKVNFIGTKESTDYDDDGNEITVTKDYVLLEDASAGYVLEGSGLGSYVKVGDVLNGKLAISLIDNFGWGIYQTTLTNGIEGVEITEGKPSPIVVTDDNILDYLADNDFRLAQFGDAVMNVDGTEIAFKSAALGDDPVSILDTYSVIPETIADGANVVLTGYMASLYGMTFFTPTAIVEKPFKATFKTDRKWAKVYAYAWSGEGENVVKFLGDWPGTELTATDGVYEVSIDANAVPEFIIFNDGGSDQTPDLPFEAGKEYKYNLDVPEGSYYVMNMAKVNEMLGSPDVEELMNSGELYNQLYMAAGHNWGTKGIVNDKGLDFTLTYNPSNKTYDFDSRVSNGGNNHFMSNGLWMDGPSYGWTIEGDVPDCTISGIFDGVKKYVAVDANQELYLTENADEPTAKWTFIHKSNYDYMVSHYGLEAMKAATVDAPVDATFLIKTPDFNRNDLRNEENWTIEAGNKNLKGGGDNGYGCAESYHSTFTLSQQLADAPAGVYALTAQGFYRQDDNKTEDAPVFYANEETATFPVKTGNENDMNAAGAVFHAGTYAIEPIFVQVTENGQLTVGAKGTATNQWVIWDNFQLKYYGADADINAVKTAYILAKVDELKQQLKQIVESGEIEVEAENAKLTAALAELENSVIDTPEKAELAVSLLKMGIDEANGYIKAKNVLPQMKKLTESTNFYTEEALENYYGQWQKKYEEATLTAAEANALQDPFELTGWRDSNNVDDLLMSAWDVAPETWDQYYINTWSVEGATDGTDFAVPFFEYWTGDDATLAEKTLTGTVSGLEPGTYGVSAWVRVRGKNNFTRPAYGITMQVNNGTAIDAAASTEVPNSNFYVGQMSAIGEVGEDGRLTLKFNVAADNNISWLSFKNVKYNKMQTFTANFENEDTWEKVYAYTWTGGEYDKVEQLGAWPGTEITATADENGVYTVTIPGIEAPANIIFSNGLEGEGHIQTEDFVFEDGKTYQYILPATDIVVTPETGADIYAAVEAEKATVKKVGSISIVLAQGGSYTVSAPLVAYKNLEIQANGATIDANELTGNFIETATTKDPTVKVPVEFVSIHNATVKGLKKPLFFSTQKGYLIEWLTIDNSIIEVAADVTSIDFTKGSAVRNFNIENSTIYAPVATTKSFFSSQAGQKLTELDAEGIQSFIIKNATMYNLATGKNFFTHRQNSQKWLTFVAENNIFVNCGKNGQAIKGMNGGGSSTNPTWTVSGNVFNFEVEGVMTDTSAAEETGDAEEPIQNSYALVMTFVDPAGGDFNADFTAAEDATIPTEKIGDPRWTLNYKAPEIEDGYYLVGNMNEWKPSAKYKLELNDGAEGVEEYMITIDLAADAQFKVVKVEGETQTFYPDGMGNAYGENGELTKGRGEYNVYFRPNADGGEGWFYGVLYVIDTTTDGINRVTIDTNKTAVYNMQGQKVMKTRKGLYIVNGKKVVLK